MSFLNRLFGGDSSSNQPPPPPECEYELVYVPGKDAISLRIRDHVGVDARW